MSSGPTLTGSKCIESTNKHYLNINFTREDWCAYPKKCRVDQLLTKTDQTLSCILCQYRKRIDIPDFLNRANKKRKKELKNGRTKDNGST